MAPPTDDPHGSKVANSDSTSLSARISNGQRELVRIRLRVSAVLIFFGVVTAVLFQVLDASWSSTARCRTSWQIWLRRFILDTLLYGRIVITSLAPVAEDLWVTRIVLFVDAALVTAFHFTDLVSVFGWSGDDSIALYAYVACDAVFLVGAVRAMFYRSGPPMNKLLWRTLQLWMTIQIPVSLALAIQKTIICRRPSNDWCDFITQVIVLLIVFRPDIQNSIREPIHRMFEATSAHRAAASVAGLVGNCRASTALAEAVERFRSIQLASLKFEDLKDNTPNPDLFGRAASVKLHKCDAFVSHSWHDDADSKWAALQEWRDDFVLERGREPNIWFDKCCIDQTNIEQDLRCLPIFLSGCQRMVVFCGPTYLSRLWCVMELFTFVHMGGKTSNIRFVPVLREGREAEDLESICEAFDSFDARNCTCFLQEDRERMLGIICAAYNSLDDFNEDVRAIFKATPWREELCAGVPDSILQSVQSARLVLEDCHREETSESTEAGDTAASDEWDVV